jgi:hypothetical protein
MSDLSLLSEEKRKFDFVAGKTAFDPLRNLTLAWRQSGMLRYRFS